VPEMPVASIHQIDVVRAELATAMKLSFLNSGLFSQRTGDHPAESAPAPLMSTRALFDQATQNRKVMNSPSAASPAPTPGPPLTLRR